MRKIRFLILTAVFALAGFSIVSCPGASPSGTANVPEGAAALGAGIALNTPFDTAALQSDITITLANVSTVDSWTAADAEAITWLKWKASADATETQDMAADTIGGVTVTATPTGEGKDRISVNIKSTAGAQKAFDGILTEIVIPADKLTSNAALAVKLGDNGVPVRFVNSGARVAGTPVVAFASGSTGVEGGSALYSIASDFKDAFVTAVNAKTATEAEWIEVTDWFSGLNGKNIRAFAKRIATQDKAAAGNDPAEVAKRTVEIVFKSDAENAPAAGSIKSDLVIESDVYLPAGAGKVTIADAVKMYVRKPADGVSATVAITKSADATKKTIKGATRTALDAELTITIDGDCAAFDISKSDEDVTARIGNMINLPLGVKASLKDDVSAGDTSFVIALSGTPSDITAAAVAAAQSPWAPNADQARALLTSAIAGYVPGANPHDAQSEAYAQYMPMLTGSYNTDDDEWTKGLLAVANPAGDDQLMWAIAETPYAVIQNATENSPKAIRGIVGQQLEDVDVLITIAGGTFVAIDADDGSSNNKISWFGTPGNDLPSSAAGDTALKAVVQESTTAESTSIMLRISGTPSAPLERKAMKITIPKEMWSGSSDLVVDTNDFAYWEAKAAYAGVSEATISGKINTALAANQTVTITLEGAKFVVFTDGEQGNNGVSTWFKNLPQGLSATATAHDAAESVEVTISGIPAAASNAPLEITIPKEMMTDLAQEPAELTSDITVEANENCKFAISPAATVANATISGTENVELAAQTVTITLAGAKFVEFKNDNKTVTDWFTNLPKGLSATAAVQAAGTSVVVTISGTPAAASDAQLAITIPANMMTDLAQELAALASQITVDANANCRFSIADNTDESVNDGDPD